MCAIRVMILGYASELRQSERDVNSCKQCSVAGRVSCVALADPGQGSLVSE